MIRLEEINRIRSKLEENIDARKTLSARYRKFYNTLHEISIGSSSINAAVAGDTTIAVLTETHLRLYRWSRQMSL